MAFIPRLSNTGIYNNRYWYSDNPLAQYGYGLPNCTCYAWGRFWELTGKKPATLPLSNAGKWYNEVTGYQKSQTPVLGAIVCYSSGTGGVGHVAVVEEIRTNGDIVTSNSGYYRPVSQYPPDTANYFWTETCSKTNGYRSSWIVNYGYTCLGFIVPDQYADGTPPSSEENDRRWTYYYWAGKSGDYPLDAEVLNNAKCLCNYLMARGWSRNAVSGVLGNAFSESRIQPRTFQEGETDPEYTGYGLIQWTPYSLLFDYLDVYAPGWRSDININGYGQASKLDDEANNRNAQSGTWGYVSWTPNEYRRISSYKEFTESTDTPEFLAITFYYGRERGAETLNNSSQRAQWARTFYDALDGFNPGDGGTSSPGISRRKHMPIWMYQRRF